MAPGIFRLRTACCTLVIPVRLAICLPLLIFTLDAYSPPSALFPGPPLITGTSAFPPPLIVNNATRPVPAPAPASGSSILSPEDAHSILDGYYALPPSSGDTHHLGGALTLSFVIAAAALSVLSLIALWWFQDLSGDKDDATIVEGDEDEGDDTERAARRLHWAALFLGTTTRLLLGGLGTAAMARVIAECSTIKRNSFITVEVLGWLLITVLYCGAFHRIHCILYQCGCGSTNGALQGDGREVLRAGRLEKRDGSFKLVSSKISHV